MKFLLVHCQPEHMYLCGDCTWHGTLHSHCKTTAKFSSL